MTQERYFSFLFTTPENSLFFSAASIWEVVIKLGLGREDIKVEQEMYEGGARGFSI
jgi:PIN domain nuclease of toxin-antitoxin system